MEEQEELGDQGPLVRAVYEKIAARGWRAIDWPQEYGGQGGSRLDQYIVEEEFYRVNIAIGLGGSGAPAILAAGWLLPASRPQPRSLGRLVLFGLGAAPVVVVQLLLQWRAYGSPLASGYGQVSDFFAFANIWPNLRGYAWRLAIGETAALALAASSLIAVAFVRPRTRSNGLSGISDRKSTRLNSSHVALSRMPSSA